ncbi:unnamed protein product [Staurois parvus]|uniref:Uncharacterized protein n=1 Tax=Staurois parvus TaxID=386267 RepID=A0ABN9HA10_9NEOB|nr:unnamed protein product [Staurois parvus]
MKQEKSAEVWIRQGQQRISQTGTGTGPGTGMQVTRYRAQEKHTPRQRLQVWPSLKYTCMISFRCLAGCRVESLIAGSTRWPALVLQPTRQVSPTITGKSIPDTSHVLIAWAGDTFS